MVIFQAAAESKNCLTLIFQNIRVMENSATGSVKINLFIRRSELEFMLQVLGAFKRKKMIDFTIENQQDALALEGPPLSEEELLKIVEDAEQESKVSYEEFKAIFEL